MTILDAVAGPILLLFPLAFFVFFAGAVLLEGWILKKIMKRTFKKSLAMSLYANGASLLVGFLLARWIGDVTYIPNYLTYFAITLLIEFGVLLLITKGTEQKNVALSALLMNITSYALLALAFWVVRMF